MLGVNEHSAREKSEGLLCVVRPALLYAAETWALTERLEGLLASFNHKILRYSKCQK